MRITKCDLCKKVIKEGKEEISLWHYGSIGTLSFCVSCAMPIVKFLNKNGFLDEKAKVQLASAA